MKIDINGNQLEYFATGEREFQKIEALHTRAPKVIIYDVYDKQEGKLLLLRRVKKIGIGEKLPAPEKNYTTLQKCIKFANGMFLYTNYYKKYYNE